MLEGLFELLVMGLFAWTGKMIAPIISLGRWRVDAERAKHPRSYTGPRYLSKGWGATIGFVFWMLMIIIIGVCLQD